MAELFEVAELVKVAVEDEKTGVAFYSRLAEKCQKLKDIFSKLAEEEKVHQGRFEEMLAGIGDYKPPEQYPGQYMEYLRTLTDDRAFPDEQTAVRMADECADEPGRHLVVLLFVKAADGGKLIGVLRRQLKLAPPATNQRLLPVAFQAELLIGAFPQD